MKKILHSELVEKAGKVVWEEHETARNCPRRPKYHFLPPAGWINDPNGQIFYKGEYHLFYQHDPYNRDWTDSRKCWGHAKSKDLVYWKHLPVALCPDVYDYDKGGVWSGCAVIDNGVPSLIYTGVQPEVQCVARSYDDMLTWERDSANPVIAGRPREDLDGFRDPCVWRERDEWVMALGSGIKEKGGAILSYSSKNLKDWKYLGLLCGNEGQTLGKNWECPDFFPIGDKYMLYVSPQGQNYKVIYSLGEYRDRKFYPEKWDYLDAGTSFSFYAPKSMIDDKGRRVMWGWIYIKNGNRWQGCLTLPRILTLDDDGTLSVNPAPELETLRHDLISFNDVVVSAEKESNLGDLQGDCVEVSAEFEINDASAFGISVFKEGDKSIELKYNPKSEEFTCGMATEKVRYIPKNNVFKIHAFLDKSVIEVYLNDKECFTTHFTPEEFGKGIDVFAEEGNVLLKSMNVWKMKSIWED